MDGSLHVAPPLPPLGALFAEDFDLPAAVPEAEVIEPVFSLGDLAGARAAALREGRVAGLAEAAAGDAAATRRAIEAIALQLADARDAAAALAEQTADAIARLLLDCLARALPAFCAHHGEAEVRAIVRSVLPALTQEQAITVRANPQIAPAIMHEMGGLDPELTARVQIVACDEMAPGDVRIAWRNGAAIRDAAALWEQVATILAPAGLLRTSAPIRETVDGN
jgi:flagellar biosynthesis/type III secretory pathway protein FliH